MNVIPMEIDGLKCECLDKTADSFERSIVEHRLIGFNGSFLEDCGLNGRSISLETLWHNENYNGHEVFLLEYSQSFRKNTLVHPIYGAITGKIQSVNVVHNSKEKRAAQISIKFLQEGEPQEFGREVYIFGAAAANTESVVAQATQKAQSEISRRAELINRMNGIRSMTAQARARISQGISVFNAVIDSVIYPSTLAGEMVKAAVSVVDAANGNIERIIQSPAAAIFGVREGLFALRRQVERQRDFGGDIFSDLILSFTLMNECLLVARSCDEFVGGSAGGDFLSSAQIAEGLAKAARNMRRFAMQIIEADKTNTTNLAKTVNLVLRGVEATLASMNHEREVNINGETSIYTVLLSQKIPTEYAESVCRRNGIENPNKASGKIFVPILERR